MKRKTFLKSTGLVTAPILLNGIEVYANASTGNGFFDYLAQTTYGCGKILVIIQMNGGNDGLNTILPIDKYASLANARASILLPETAILPLNGNANTGMHPAMQELKTLYDDGKMVIVQGVSYPNPNFSHFRATDIWFSGSASNVTLSSGWIGRALDTNYPSYPASYPNAQMPDPVAIQIGSTLPFSLQGPIVNMGYNVTDPNQLLNVLNATTDPAPNNDYGRELTFLRLMKDQSNAYRSSLQNAYTAQQTLSTLYPASGNALADQLKIVARLIGGGLKTPVYIVNHPNSYDTHSDQVVASNKATGYHANALTILSKAIGAFQSDLKLMGKDQMVTGMTFSEFGRRIISNASLGTDHGSAAPVLFFGAALNAGIIGTSPNIPVNAGVNDQVPLQYDFRQLYSTVMQDWLCLSKAETTSVLGSDFAKLPIFKSAVAPLKSIVLSGQYVSGKVTLNFIVEDNTIFRRFLVEFSTNGTSFTTLRTIDRVSLNKIESYQYVHDINAPKMYYRITGELSASGNAISDTLLLTAEKNKQLMSIYPNPVADNRVNIKIFDADAKDVDVTIFDLLGARMYYNRFAGANTLLRFTVPQFFTKKTHYILELRYGAVLERTQISFE